ncbi:MAG: hypothetical protein IAF08_01660 [Rhizobacter sp.]|nr:hypothetical protein [Chlorobiales bacterium]
MYREIFVPKETKLTIELPEEFVGKAIEVIAFSIPATVPAAALDDAIAFWQQHRIDLSQFKFNRIEANER